MAEPPPKATAVDRSAMWASRGDDLPVGFLLDVQGPPPSLDALRDLAARRLPHLPALHRLLPRRDGTIPPAPPTPVGTHVKELLPDPHTPSQAATGHHALNAPLPSKDAAPWDLWLIRGTDPHAYRLCYRIHHALQDGVGAAHTVAALLGGPGNRGPYPHLPRRPTRAALRRVTGQFTASWGPVPHWPRLSAPPAGRPVLVHADVPARRLRALARARGTTVNDVYLAALARAFRSLNGGGTTSGGCPPLPALVPMSTRTAGQEHLPGNQVVAMRVLLPSHLPAPADCLRQVHRQTALATAAGQRDAMRLILSAVPDAAGAWFVRRMALPRTTPLYASSVAFPTPLTCLGGRVTAAAMFTGITRGLLCYVSLTGYEDTRRFTVVHDRAFTGGDRLPELWLDALDALDIPDARAVLDAPGGPEREPGRLGP
ncbi:wax ester/triacylglycerol synthase family O-acyltransferase [Streptomyces ziwulingensis]|uniref:Wax ester/triacylglycerol synthase family O-acyltransferase n=2 Tax=Streptomyces ziwulingensis TaxID=1045501 RepID=A0ABP9CT82_9ACTN